MDFQKTKTDMKNLFFITMLLSAFTFSSCKKCFTCSNICEYCQLIDNTGAVLQSKTLCSDSTTPDKYAHDLARKDSLVSRGFVCNAAASTTVKDFCSNNAATDQYKEYYNDKQFTCKEK
jgi:hypothetical protein